jgi:hypothetical protein
LPTGVASVQDFSGIAGVVLKAAVARLPLRVGQILEKMRMLAKRHHLIAVAAATMALGFAATAADAAGLFTLSSTTFSDGKIMPKKVANSKVNAPNNPNCVGDNVSPQFSWNNVPDGTKSFAFLMIDPEGRAPGGVHGPE